MANEHGEWIMRGLDWNDPARVRSWEELLDWIDGIGFLPLFRNEIDGFSVEEHTSDRFWWTGDPAQDPWEWRVMMARSGRAAYGKFFGKKAGFISKAWFPHFANFRRYGYDFDSRWDDALASMRAKKIMDRFEENTELFSFQLKQQAGFGKGGEKNFEGVVTDLQMQGYLVIRDFRQHINKKGVPYGWPISVYSTPEALWGYDDVTSAYSLDPAVSGKEIRAQVKKSFPGAQETELDTVLG